MNSMARGKQEPGMKESSNRFKISFLKPAQKQEYFFKYKSKVVKGWWGGSMLKKGLNIPNIMTKREQTNTFIIFLSIYILYIR